MADKNRLKCVVCGKRDKLMKRCGRCQSTFYCSIECQRSDWGKHKTNCCIHKTQDTSHAEMTRAIQVGKALDAAVQTTDEAKFKNFTVQELEKNAEEDTYNNLKYFPGNCQVNSPQNFAENLLNHAAQTSCLIENAQTVKQQTKTVDKINEHIGNEQSDVGDFEKLETRRNHIELQHTCTSHVPITILKDDVSKVAVYVKYAKEKHTVEIDLPCTGLQTLKHFSCLLHVPLERLKIIHKGKLQTESTIVERLKPNSVFLAFGEMAESEDGLDAEDIDLIMKQLSVERNVAIKALRKTNCLVDAIFEIGNDM